MAESYKEIAFCVAKSKHVDIAIPAVPFSVFKEAVDLHCNLERLPFSTQPETGRGFEYPPALGAAYGQLWPSSGWYDDALPLVHCLTTPTLRLFLVDSTAYNSRMPWRPSPSCRMLSRFVCPIAPHSCILTSKFPSLLKRREILQTLRWSDL